MRWPETGQLLNDIAFEDVNESIQASIAFENYDSLKDVADDFGFTLTNIRPDWSKR